MSKGCARTIRITALAGVIFVCMSATVLAKEDVKHSARVVMPKPKQESVAKLDRTASPPMRVVQDFYDRLIYVMQKGEKLGFQGRYDALKPAIEDAFDLPLMTRFAAGSGWIAADPAQQKNLVKAFSDFSIATYAGRFASYSNEKFKVLGEKNATGGGVIVESQLVSGGDPPVTLNYLLRKDDKGAWRINDVYLDATISELATRRAEFSAVIKSDGVDALIDNIGKKSKAMQTLQAL